MHFIHFPPNYIFDDEENTCNVPINATLWEVTRKAPGVLVADEVQYRFFTISLCVRVYLAARAEVGGWSEFSIRVSFRNPHQFQTKDCTMGSSSTFAAKVLTRHLLSVQLLSTPWVTEAITSFLTGSLSKIYFDISA